MRGATQLATCGHVLGLWEECSLNSKNTTMLIVRKLVIDFGEWDFIFTMDNDLSPKDAFNDLLHDSIYVDAIVKLYSSWEAAQHGRGCAVWGTSVLSERPIDCDHTPRQLCSLLPEWACDGSGSDDSQSMGISQSEGIKVSCPSENHTLRPLYARYGSSTSCARTIPGLPQADETNACNRDVFLLNSLHERLGDFQEAL